LGLHGFPTVSCVALPIQRPDRGHEAVAPLGYGFNEFASIAVVSKSLSQEGDALRERGLFDKGVRPEMFEEGVFRDEMPSVFHEKKKSVEDLGRELDTFPAAPKLPLCDVHRELAESEARH